eukprot:9468822-Pyramimonas_sp.AAC.1
MSKPLFCRRTCPHFSRNCCSSGVPLASFSSYAAARQETPCLRGAHEAPRQGQEGGPPSVRRGSVRCWQNHRGGIRGEEAMRTSMRQRWRQG